MLKKREGHKLPTREGFVAFLDILGYKSLIENNSIDDVVSIITTAFDGVRRWRKTSQYANKPKKGPYKMVFSDSILLHTPFDPSATVEDKREVTFPFLFFCHLVMRSMFQQGLPCRGAVALGDYYVRTQGVLLAGKPIVEAYEAATKIPFAGCLLTENVKNMLPQDGVPVVCVNWAPPGFNTQSCFLRFFLPIATGEVESHFSAHHKPIEEPRVRDKIRNTIEFINHQNH